MNLKKLENTEWAKKFKEFSFLCYEQALSCIRDGCNVEIYYNNETGD